jgi:hypothetical protein
VVPLVTDKSTELIQQLQGIAQDLSNERARLIERVRSLPSKLSDSLDGVDEPIVSKSAESLDAGCQKMAALVDTGVEELLRALKKRIESIQEATS